MTPPEKSPTMLTRVLSSPRLSLASHPPLAPSAEAGLIIKRCGRNIGRSGESTARRGSREVSIECNKAISHSDDGAASSAWGAAPGAHHRRAVEADAAAGARCRRPAPDARPGARNALQLAAAPAARRSNAARSRSLRRYRRAWLRTRLAGRALRAARRIESAGAAVAACHARAAGGHRRRGAARRWAVGGGGARRRARST